MIECTKFTPVNKGNLIGFASLYIDKWGVEIFSISLNQKDGRKWITFPSKSYEKDGEKKFLPYFRIKDKGHYEQFCKNAIEAIEKKANEINTVPSQEEMPF